MAYKRNSPHSSQQANSEVRLRLRNHKELLIILSGTRLGPKILEDIEKSDRIFYGLHVTIGWDSEFIARTFPIVFCSIWMCVIAWKLWVGGWDTALALGNLIASLLTLVYIQAQHHR